MSREVLSTETLPLNNILQFLRVRVELDLGFIESRRVPRIINRTPQRRISFSGKRSSYGT
ncbi:hypothetical protein LINGRAHAP2_LOCUS10321 [Linum grandiflorum]